MASSNTLEQQLNNFVRSLQEQQILDISFNEVRKLNSAEKPRFVIDIISIYCKDAEKRITEMTKIVSPYPCPVDYDKLLAVVRKLKGSSLCIGGKQVAATCGALQQGCREKNRERCVAAMQVLIDKSIILHDRLNSIAQFEKNILNSRGKIGGA